MIAYRQNLVFSALTLAVVFLFWIFAPVSPQTDIIILMMSLLTTGIPHGAIDHVIYAAKTKAAGKTPIFIRNFFVPYLILIGLTFLCWFLIPEVMFWIFLGVAAYHFGQSQLYYLPLEAHPFLKSFLYMAWGTMLLSALWITHWDAQNQHISTLFSWNFNQNGPLYIAVNTFRIAGLVFCLLILAALWVREKINGKVALLEIAVIPVLFLMINSLTLYGAFALYFGLWHSLRVILTEYYFLQKAQYEKISIRSFLVSFIPFSLFSIAGLTLILMGSYVLKGHISPFMLFLIFISALTMPHVYFMETMYRWLSGRVQSPQKGAINYDYGE